MPLTNAEKQKRHRQKRGATIARYEAALMEIAGRDMVEAMLDPQWATITAAAALNPVIAGGYE